MLGTLIERSRASWRQVKTTVGLECRVRLPSRILGLGQEWTEAKSRCPARRRVTIRKEQLAAGVWSSGGLRPAGVRIGDGDKASADNPTGWHRATLSAFVGGLEWAGEMRLLGGSDSDDPGEFSFCVTERSLCKGHLWLRGSIWEKDRVRCAVPARTLPARYSTRRRFRGLLLMLLTITPP